MDVFSTSALHRLRQRLGRRQVVLGFGSAYLLSQIVLAILLHPLGSSRVLRLQTTLSATEFLDIVGMWQAQGLLPIYLRHYLLDFVHPLWYAVALSALLALVFDANRVPGQYNCLLLTPFVAGTLDLFENVCHLVFLSDLNHLPRAGVALSGFAGGLKWLLALGCLEAVVGMAVWRLYSRKPR